MNAVIAAKLELTKPRQEDFEAEDYFEFDWFLRKYEEFESVAFVVKASL